MALLENKITNVWCIRHGERLEDVDPEYAKKTDLARIFDLPLSDFGVRQAHNFGAVLSKELLHIPNYKCIKCIYVSPMLRTIQTANEICKMFQLDMVIVPSLSMGSHIVHQFGLKFDNKKKK
eukprot:788372_1